MSLVDKINLALAIYVALSICVGVIVIISDEIKDFALFLKTQGKIRKKEKIAKETKRERDLRMLIESTTNGFLSPFSFKAITFGLFAFFFVATINALSLFFAVPLAFGMASITYVYLKFLSRRKQNGSSKEAELLVNTVWQFYRLENENMPNALDRMIKEAKGLRYTLVMLGKIKWAYMNSQNNFEIKNACDLFAYEIGTNWARILSDIFYRSLADKQNVLISLEDLNAELMEARSIVEDSKRMNVESLLLLFFTPLCYFIMMYIAYRLGISPAEFIQKQFSDVKSTLMFVGIILFAFLGVICEYIIRHKKFDF